mmetsp:Transcript_11545/g.25005  ORF Transcript_11545/g.25005 Transcript_11545/m.25005 type:complete len:225 (-) Transcript_11545:232-906(-)
MQHSPVQFFCLLFVVHVGIFQLLQLLSYIGIYAGIDSVTICTTAPIAYLAHSTHGAALARRFLHFRLPTRGVSLARLPLFLPAEPAGDVSQYFFHLRPPGGPLHLPKLLERLDRVPQRPREVAVLPGVLLHRPGEGERLGVDDGYHGAMLGALVGEGGVGAGLGGGHAAGLGAGGGLLGAGPGIGFAAVLAGRSSSDGGGGGARDLCGVVPDGEGGKHGGGSRK